MYCRKCGKEIDDNAIFCPACGTQTLNAGGQPQQPQQPQPQVTVVGNQPYVMPVNQPADAPFGMAQPQPNGVNGLGIAGFILGILSLGLGAYFCITPIIGLVLSIVGVAKMKFYKSCNALAIVGLVLSILATVIWGLVWLILGAALIGSL